MIQDQIYKRVQISPISSSIPTQTQCMSQLPMNTFQYNSLYTNPQMNNCYQLGYNQNSLQQFPLSQGSYQYPSQMQHYNNQNLNMANGCLTNRPLGLNSRVEQVNQNQLLTSLELQKQLLQGQNSKIFDSNLISGIEQQQDQYQKQSVQLNNNINTNTNANINMNNTNQVELKLTTPKLILKEEIEQNIKNDQNQKQTVILNNLLTQYKQQQQKLTHSESSKTQEPINLQLDSHRDSSTGIEDQINNQNRDEKQQTLTTLHQEIQNNIPKIDLSKCQNSSLMELQLIAKRKQFSHSKPKIFIDCPIKNCSYRSYVKSNISKHIRRRHKDALIYCPRCEYSCTFQSDLERHNKQSHKSALKQ